MSKAATAIKVIKYATLVWPLAEKLWNKIMSEKAVQRRKDRRAERRKRRELRRINR